jgi:hypothetical protein
MAIERISELQLEDVGALFSSKVQVPPDGKWPIGTVAQTVVN